MIEYLKEESQFQELIQKEQTLVDFYADWCGPCKRMGEILEEMEGIDILKVNVDLFPELARQYKVLSIPTMILFQNGEAVKKQIGLLEKESLESWIHES